MVHPTLLETAIDASTLAALLGIAVVLVVLVVLLAAEWRIHTKSGQPGWAALIPIYDVIVLLQIVGRPRWWLLLLLIPSINIIFIIIVLNDLSKAFGKGVGFTLGLLFLSPIFVAILGFGSARYVRGAAVPAYR